MRGVYAVRELLRFFRESKINKNQLEMKEKYYAIEILNEIFVMNSEDLSRLVSNNVQHAIIGRVCTDKCDTTCLHYSGGTCPCKFMRDVDGRFIHILV